MKRRARLTRQPAALWQQGTGVLALLLIFTLVLLGASPLAHEWVHDRGHSSHSMTCADVAHSDAVPASAEHDDDDGCAVTLFTHGLVAAAGGPPLVVGLERQPSLTPLSPEVLFLASPRHAHPPLCGPPVV